MRRDGRPNEPAAAMAKAARTRLAAQTPPWGPQ
jgi:hypothetical protein